MSNLVLIVEGDGEVSAARLLARRVLEHHGLYDVQVTRPIRVRKDQFVNHEMQRNRYLELAHTQAGNDGRIVVLLDSDGACPRDMVGSLLPLMRTHLPQASIALVIAHTEFEAWFLASAASISGRCGLPEHLEQAVDPEGVGSPKAWIQRRLPRGRGYSETIDQPAIAGTFDWQDARVRARSLDKFCREILSSGVV